MAPPPDADALLIRTWLHNRPAATVAAYRADIAALLQHAGKPVAELTLADLQAWHDSMSADAPASRCRRLAAARSLLRYAAECGAIAGDPSRGLRLARATSTAPERIVAEAAMRRMIAAEADPRRRAVLRLVYITGLRASEAAGLRWRDMTARGKHGGEARILGKGSKLRTVAIPPGLWRDLAELRGAAGRPDDPVLTGRDGRALNRSGVHRAVKRAARRIGLPDVSPHWLRHSSASHALDHGAPVHVVQASLGHASLATTTRYAHVKRGDGAARYLPET